MTDHANVDSAEIMNTNTKATASKVTGPKAKHKARESHNCAQNITLHLVIEFTTVRYYSLKCPLSL